MPARPPPLPCFKHNWSARGKLHGAAAPWCCEKAPQQLRARQVVHSSSSPQGMPVQTQQKLLNTHLSISCPAVLCAGLLGHHCLGWEPKLQQDFFPAAKYCTNALYTYSRDAESLQSIFPPVLTRYVAVKEHQPSARTLGLTL